MAWLLATGEPKQGWGICSGFSPRRLRYMKSCSPKLQVLLRVAISRLRKPVSLGIEGGGSQVCCPFGTLNTRLRTFAGAPLSPKP